MSISLTMGKSDRCHFLYCILMRQYFDFFFAIWQSQSNVKIATITILTFFLLCSLYNLFCTQVSTTLSLVTKNVGTQNLMFSPCLPLPHYYYINTLTCCIVILQLQTNLLILGSTISVRFKIFLFCLKSYFFLRSVFSNVVKKKRLSVLQKKVGNVISDNRVCQLANKLITYYRIILDFFTLDDSHTLDFPSK